MSEYSDSYSTSCQHEDGSITEIRVHLTKNGRAVVESRFADSKAMIERCVWRFIALQHEADTVKGDTVEFVVGAEEIARLCDELSK